MKRKGNTTIWIATLDDGTLRRVEHHTMGTETGVLRILAKELRPKLL